MSRNAVLLIWGFGALLALVLIFAGPNPVERALSDAVAQLQMLTDRLDDATMAAVRGVAIALFCVFLALCVLALRRGQPAIGTAIVVSLLFLLLAGHVFAWVIYLHRPHWVLALLLALFAALDMTRRVRSPVSVPMRRG
jgi:Ca2+/Na+ antiporter